MTIHQPTNPPIYQPTIIMDIQITAEHEANIHVHPTYDIQLLPLFGATGETDFNGYLIAIAVTSTVLGEEHTTNNSLACRALTNESTAETLERAMIMVGEVVRSVDKGLRNSGVGSAHLN